MAGWSLVTRVVNKQDAKDSIHFLGGGSSVFFFVDLSFLATCGIFTVLFWLVGFLMVCNLCNLPFTTATVGKSYISIYLYKDSN
jgi:hypothetical protein